MNKSLEVVNNLMKCRIKTRQYTEWMEVLERMIVSTDTYRREEGILLVGPSGSGKTSLIKSLAAKYPEEEEKDRLHIKVLSLSMPANPTIISFCKIIMDKLGQGYSNRATENDLTYQVKKLLSGAGVSLLVVDEAQHLVDGNKIQKSPAMVADWIKELMNESSVSVALAGVPSVEILTDSNEQLGRRFSRRIYLDGYPAKDADEAKDLYKFIIKLIKESGYKGDYTYVKNPKTIKNIAYSTNGRIGYISKLLAEALRLAVENNDNRLKSEHFEKAFKSEIWYKSDVSTNPFSGKCKFNGLANPGGPFYVNAVA